jgi:neurotransmitter:Na+ symporter, NSS family
VAGGGTALVSIVYATGGGINTLDVVDNFINLFGIAAVGLVEVVVVAWLLRELPTLRDHANATSDLRLGRWWVVSLGIVTPLVLGWMLLDNLRLTLAEPYGDLPQRFLLVSGWGVAALALVAGILLSRRSWPEEVTLQRPADPMPRRPEGPSS